MSTAFNVQDRRRRGQSLFFTPVAESPPPESGSPASVRSPTRRRSKPTIVDAPIASGSRESGGGIQRSSSSPLIVSGHRGLTSPILQPLSPIHVQPNHGENPFYGARRNAHSHSHLSRARSRSQQNLVSIQLSQLQTAPSLRQPFFQPLHQIHAASPYSGSDADDDLNDEPDEHPLLVRRRSGSGNLNLRRSQSGQSAPVPFSSVSAPVMTKRRDVRVPDGETEQHKVIPADSGLTHRKEDGTPARHAPRSKQPPVVITINGHSIQWNIQMDSITPLLFQCLCTLAAIPAVTETFSLLMKVAYPRPGASRNTALDYIVSAAWSILTAHQCFAFTTGLLTRWQHYYPLPATLIRLVALQAICWPATFYTLRFLQWDGVERPLVCWAAIGTTTCVTRSIQMWVTSNIDEWHRNDDDTAHRAQTMASIALGFGEKKLLAGNETEREDSAKPSLPPPRKRSQSNGSPNSSKVRKWDWNEVVWKCAFPAGICYFFMAWALLLRQELYGDHQMG